MNVSDVLKSIDTAERTRSHHPHTDEQSIWTTALSHLGNGALASAHAEYNKLRREIPLGGPKAWVTTYKTHSHRLLLGILAYHKEYENGDIPITPSEIQNAFGQFPRQEQTLAEIARLGGKLLNKTSFKEGPSLQER